MCLCAGASENLMDCKWHSATRPTRENDGLARKAMKDSLETAMTDSPSLHYGPMGLRSVSGSSVMAISSSSFIAFLTCLPFYGDRLVALLHSLIGQNCCREYQMVWQSIHHKFNRWQDSNYQCWQYRTSWRIIRLSNGKKICQYREAHWQFRGDESACLSAQ